MPRLMILVRAAGTQAIRDTSTRRFTRRVGSPHRFRYVSALISCRSQCGTKNATTGIGRTASEESSAHSDPAQWARVCVGRLISSSTSAVVQPPAPSTATAARAMSPLRACPLIMVPPTDG
jgi:hypothetical protein